MLDPRNDAPAFRRANANNHARAGFKRLSIQPEHPCTNVLARPRGRNEGQDVAAFDEQFPVQSDPKRIDRLRSARPVRPATVRARPRSIHTRRYSGR